MFSGFQGLFLFSIYGDVIISVKSQEEPAIDIRKFAKLVSLLTTSSTDSLITFCFRLNIPVNVCAMRISQDSDLIVSMISTRSVKEITLLTMYVNHFVGSMSKELHQLGYDLQQSSAKRMNINTVHDTIEVPDGIKIVVAEHRIIAQKLSPNLSQTTHN